MRVASLEMFRDTELKTQFLRVGRLNACLAARTEELLQSSVPERPDHVAM